MKKTLAAMMAILLTVVGIFTAADQPHTSRAEFLPQEQETCTMQGTVSRLTDSGILMLNTDGTLILVSLAGDTAWDTVGEPEPGDVILVTYNGFMSRSIPSRITAMSVSCHRLHGTVAEPMDAGFTMLCDDGTTVSVISEDVRAAGTEVTVWYDGTENAGTIQAWHTRGPLLTGSVTGISSENSTLMLDTGAQECVIGFGSASVVPERLEVGMTVRVAVGDTMTLSLPAMYEALEILPE